MKNFLYTALAIILFTPAFVWALPSAIDRITDHIEPLNKTDYMKASHFTASTTATNTLPIVISSSTVTTNLTVQSLISGCLSSVSGVITSSGVACGSGLSTTTPWITNGTSVVLATTSNFVGIGTSTPTVALSVVGEGLFSDNVTMGKLFKINALTGNPEFNFQENGTTRAKTYYDITGNQLVFQNNEVNTDDALYFADSATFTNKLTVDGTTRLATSLSGFLKAVSGTVSATSSISLTTDISGILGGSNGGTGLTSTSTLLYESEIDTSAKLRGLLTDELGTGPAVFASSSALTSPTLYSPSIITAILTGNIDAGGATVKQHTYKSFSFPTFATTTSATTTIDLGTAYTAESWSGADCYTSSGSVAYIFTDGTNRMNGITATTTVSTLNLSTNNTFTAKEKRYVEIGPLTSAKLVCTVDIIVNN